MSLGAAEVMSASGISSLSSSSSQEAAISNGSCCLGTISKLGRGGKDRGRGRTPRGFSKRGSTLFKYMPNTSGRSWISSKRKSRLRLSGQFDVSPGRKFYNKYSLTNKVLLVRPSLKLDSGLLAHSRNCPLIIFLLDWFLRGHPDTPNLLPWRV